MEFTAPDTSRTYDITAPMTIEWTLPESARNLTRMILTLFVDTMEDGEVVTYWDDMEGILDPWSLRYEWDPSNFTRYLDEISVTVLPEKRNRLHATLETARNENGTHPDYYTSMDLKGLVFEEYPSPDPDPESGATMFGRPSLVAGTGALAAAMVFAVCIL